MSNGKSVTHLDHRNYYGGCMASLNGKNLLAWCDHNTQSSSNVTTSSCDNVLLINQSLDYWHSHRKININPDNYDSIIEGLSANSYRYNIDLMPRALLCRSEIVDVFIRSGTSRYCEFTGLSVNHCLDVPVAPEGDIITANENADWLISIVPLTKSEIFMDRNLTPLEKRSLMKFVMNFTHLSKAFSTPKVIEQQASHLVEATKRSLLQKEAEEFEKTVGNNSKGNEKKDEPTWTDFLLKDQKLTLKVANNLTHGVCLCSNALSSLSWSQSDGLFHLRRFIASIGVFNEKSPLLAPMCGSGDLPQAFVRLGAVQGAIYALRIGIKNLKFDAEAGYRIIGGNLENGQDFKVKHSVVISEEYLPSAGRVAAQRLGLIRKSGRGVAYLTVICNDSLLDHANGFAMAFAPPPGVKQPVFVLQMDSASMCCPKGKYIIYLMRAISIEEEEHFTDNIDRTIRRDLNHVLNCLVKRREKSKKTDSLNSSDDSGQESKKNQIIDVALEFVRGIEPDATAESDVEEAEIQKWTSALQSNLFIVPLVSNDSLFVLHEELTTAKSIFAKLCPEEEFLPTPDFVNKEREAQSKLESLESKLLEEKFEESIEDKDEELED